MVFQNIKEQKGIFRVRQPLMIMHKTTFRVDVNCFHCEEEGGGGGGDAGIYIYNGDMEECLSHVRGVMVRSGAAGTC